MGDSEADARHFGSRMREARRAKETPLRVLAERLGCGHVWLGEVERGLKTMPDDYLPKLAAALEVGVEVVQAWNLSERKNRQIVNEEEQSTEEWVRQLAELPAGKAEMLRVVGEYIDERASSAFGYKGPDAVAQARGFARWLKSRADRERGTR